MSFQAKVLVVDDTPHNVKLLADVLTIKGYSVVTAASGEEALVRLAADNPDLVLLDIMMPGLSGYDVCRRIRADPQTALLPVILVTSLDPKQERINGIEAGADDFLSKPINRDELCARVASLLRIRRLHQQTLRQADELAEWGRTLDRRVNEAVAEVQRLSRLKRFFSPNLVELIVRGGAEDPLESHRREIVVVYLDLRGFTAFSETAEPEEVMRALAAYHEAMGRIITEYEATLERFTGDAIMIFFGDPLPVDDAASKALSMALAMREAASQLSAGWKARGVDLGLGIGIAQGFATLGAIGYPGRIDYGAIGPVTNLACRLCEQAAAGEILLSQRIFSETSDRYVAEDIGNVELHGFVRPLRVYRCIGARSGATDVASRGLREAG